MPSNIAHGGTVAFSGANGTTDLDYNNNGTLLVAGALEEFTGSISSTSGQGQAIIGSGGTIQLDAAIANNTISFTDNTGGLVIEQVGSVAASVNILGLQAGDTIDLANLPSFFVENYATTTGTLSLADSSGNLLGSLVFAGNQLPSAATVQNAIIAINPACYMRGTRLATTNGDIAVEALSIGMSVITASGQARPVTWIGRRMVDCDIHPDPQQVWPVCIRQGAFDEGRPACNLYLSPDHAVQIGECLVPIKHLMNGSSIAQVEMGRVEYWHIELDKHDIVVANGLACESYLDTGNRTSFDNNYVVTKLYADFGRIVPAKPCLPLVEGGALVVAEKQRVFHRAGLSAVKPKPMLQVLGNRTVLASRNLGRGLLSYALPQKCKSLALMSPTWTPAFFDSSSLDIRRLGVRLLQIWVDGCPIDLLDPALKSGFYPVEDTREGQSRWTNGAAEIDLPASAGRIMLRVADGAAPLGVRHLSRGGRAVNA